MLAGRYAYLMPTWFLAPITGLKLPTQVLKPVVSLHKTFKTELEILNNLWGLGTEEE
jgi:hypothetical protein